MGHNENEPRQGGAWTPFVGVALAVLTAGSLVLFSFVAQRTSLDGFETRGVTAVAPSGATPHSITLPGGAQAAAPQSDATGDTLEGTTATSLLGLSPTSSLLGSDLGSVPQIALSPTAQSGADVAASPDRTVGPTGDRLQASFAGGGDNATLFRNAETTDGKAQAKAKNKAKNKNDGKAKKDKTKKEKKAKGRAALHKERGQSGGSGHGRASHNSSTGRSASSSAPAHSSRPAPRPKPQKAAQSSSGHSNTKGKGHSKGRGRGHAND